ncbi:hypothetical protein ACGFZS_27725 [Streptomyces sp. NPDC048288]|uniref:hypothetical protein n=1 Tax=Streptomyces sp. NPDC048288 TaxID=3365529 RepID=UPI00371FF45B
MAAVVDHLAVANWMFATVNRDEDTDPADYPEPVPRPVPGDGVSSADGPSEPRRVTPAEIVAFLNSPG